MGVIGTCQTARMDLNRYTFRSVWRITAARADVFAVLGDLSSYPAWWPEVRRSERIDETTFELSCRSLLPYDLVFRSVQERYDPAQGVLQARLLGDLDGFSRWTVTSDTEGTTAVFDEEVVATKSLLRRLAPIARPVFQGNHWLMMNHGQAGLGVYLAGYLAGASAETSLSWMGWTGEG
jgi:Polyketide cyclase / dehydrase and lipid transport